MRDPDLLFYISLPEEELGEEEGVGVGMLGWVFMSNCQLFFLLPFYKPKRLHFCDSKPRQYWLPGTFGRGGEAVCLGSDWDLNTTPVHSVASLGSSSLD